MDKQTRAGFTAVRDHVDQTRRIQDADHKQLVKLITRNDEDIEGLTRKLATLQAKIKALCDQTQTPARDESQ